MTIENYKTATNIVTRLDQISDALKAVEDDNVDVSLTYGKPGCTYGIDFNAKQFADMRMYLLAALKKEQKELLEKLNKL